MRTANRLSPRKEYVSINSDNGKLISIALAASGITFKGRFDKERMLWGYDGIYKESVDEIITKFTSDKYAEQRNEIAEHKGNNSLSISAQKEECIRFVGECDYRIYCDDGKSGKDVMHRPSLRNVMSLPTKKQAL